MTKSLKPEDKNLIWVRKMMLRHGYECWIQVLINELRMRNTKINDTETHLKTARSEHGLMDKEIQNRKRIYF